MSAAFEVPGYVDVEQIGAGGFGRVFRARQPAFDRTVAVKLLNGRLDDEATLRRFRRECQALGAVSSHPNIVPVYDAGATADGRPYLVMDFVRGGSLADRLARSGPLPWAEVAAIGVKLSGALASAHAAGVLHRDIKPENILVSGYGEPQLADFGIAQRMGVDNRTATAAAMTPSHSAPEQFSGSPPSEVTDVYALASTLFTLLAGRSPFQGRPGESVFALMARATTEPVPDLRPLGVPDPLARAVERALSKDPALRPPSALAFGDLLQQAQQQLRVPVTSIPVARDDHGAPPPTERYPLAPPPTERYPLAPQNPPGPAPDSGTPQPRGRGRGWWVAALAVLAVVAAAVAVVISLHGLGSTSGGPSSAGPATSTPSGSRTASTSASPTSASTTATSPATSTSPTPASSSATTPVTTGNPAALLLPAGTDPLAGYQTVDPALVPIPASGQYFCGRTVDLAGPQAATTMTDPTTGTFFGEQLSEVGSAGATQAMSQLRASTSCGQWVGAGGVTETVTPGQPVAVGDDSATYLTTSPAAQLTQVFFRQGTYFCVITVGAAGRTLDAADTDLAARAAAAAAGRLP